MNLYFQHSNRHIEHVAENITAVNAWTFAQAHLMKRDPNRKVTCVRQWESIGKESVNFDYGCEDEFYFMSEPEVAIVRKIVEVGSENTIYGSWFFDYETINSQFHVNLPFDVKLIEKIEQEVHTRYGDSVEGIEFGRHDDGICIWFYLDACPNAGKERLFEHIS